MINVVLGMLLLRSDHFTNSFVVASIAIGTFGEGSVLVFVWFDWISGMNQEKEMVDSSQKMTTDLEGVATTNDDTALTERLLEQTRGASVYK